MARLERLTGLFLGAGASYELGMPVASGLTTELKSWLTPQKLRDLNTRWQRHRCGYADVVIDNFVSALSRQDQNYENLLGYLEVQYARNSEMAEDYHGLHSWLVQLVYYLLYYRHINNLAYIQRQIPNYAGLVAFVEQNHPLWIFSLNHDVLVECIALTHALPLSCGFTEELVHLPRTTASASNIIAPLKAEILPAKNIKSIGMHFLPLGRRGINLLKIHGGLDTFTFRNGNDLLRILPLCDSVEGLINSLRAVNEEIWHPASSRIRPINEVAYADQAGEMQFLRRSLLAGTFKFDPRHNQVLPHDLLEHFRTHLNFIHTLVCIGYSFGDDHVNRIIRDWLELRPSRNLVVVGPSITAVPAAFLHVASQLQLSTLTTTDYLDSHAGIQRSKSEMTEKKFTAYVRGTGKDAMKELLSFSREHTLGRFQEWFDKISQQDSRLDIGLLSVPPETLVEEVKKLIPSTDEILEEFVRTRPC